MHGYDLVSTIIVPYTESLSLLKRMPRVYISFPNDLERFTNYSKSFIGVYYNKQMSFRVAFKTALYKMHKVSSNLTCQIFTQAINLCYQLCSTPVYLGLGCSNIYLPGLALLEFAL